MIRLLHGQGSYDYVLQRASGTGQRRANRIANAKHESRLPCGIMREFCQLSRGSRVLVPAPFMIDELHGFIDRSSRDSTARQQKMRSLPDSPRSQALFLVVTIAHSDEAKNRRGSQLICVGIAISTRSELYQ